MKIYLAARYARREELCRYADDLKKKGHEVQARWLSGNHEMSESVVGETMFKMQHCKEDMEDVQACDTLIAFTEYPNAMVSGAGRGGRHVELGLALAWGKTVFVVGPRENIFCYAPNVMAFKNWYDFYCGLLSVGPDWDKYTEVNVKLPIDFIANPTPIGDSEEPSAMTEQSPFQSPMTIADLIRESHGTALAKGWWAPKEGQPERNFPEQIALMHSELSEALEEFRTCGLDRSKFLYYLETSPPGKDKKPEGIAAEFADVLIRIFDTCGRYGIPLAKALQDKCAYNRTRPFRHGGKQA